MAAQRELPTNCRVLTTKDVVRKHHHGLHCEPAGLEKASSHPPAEKLAALCSRDTAASTTALPSARPILLPVPIVLGHVLSGEWCATAHLEGPVTNKASESCEARPEMWLRMLAALRDGMLRSEGRHVLPALLSLAARG